jgi:ribosomal protein S18 acetylase RimI-like enzyme
MTSVDEAITMRAARPDDYERIVGVVDRWWGRPISSVLPRLFVDHFHRTSLIAERGGAMAGFLVGFFSPSNPDAAYIHFVGVAPELRGQGLARRLYDEFFAAATRAGCTRVAAITSPANETSIAFHRAMGFTVRGPIPDYDGPGVHRIVFERTLIRSPI